jgi:hypothetical protein
MTIYKVDTVFEDQATYNMKIQVQDTSSMQAVIETLFDVTIYHKCSRNTFTINDQADVPYQISATGTTAAVTIPKTTVSLATTGCTLEYTVEVLEYASNTWKLVDATIVSSTYSFIVAAPASTTSNTFQV